MLPRSTGESMDHESLKEAKNSRNSALIVDLCNAARL